MGTTESNFTPAELQDAHLERDQSQKLAQRYRCPFVDLNTVRIDPELFRVIPADLMFRFNFVPLEAHDHQLVIAVADPSQVLLSDELTLLLGKKLVLRVATATQIGDLLKRTEQSQRVLEQATEAFTLQVVARRGRERAVPLRGSAHCRHGRQSGRPPGGHRYFHGSGTPRQ